MLQKENRLKKRSAFSATYRTGKVVRAEGITAFLGKEKNDVFPTKFGFVVSKKIHKRAVKRNRIKRLMRESVRLNTKYISECKYISVIFVASARFLDKNFKDVDEAMKKLVSKL